MTTAVAVELGPLVRAGAPSSSSSSSQRIPLPRRRRAAGAIRASPVSGRSEDAGEPPATLLPNARRRGRDPLWYGGGFSLGVDLGDARTGLAVGRGITLPRPLTVLKLRGQKLELTLLDVARQQEADELIIGLPVSADGRETPQSNKVRSVVGRLAVQAAERGVKKSARDVKSDAYAAVMILKRYFTSSGQGAKIVLPRQPELQEKLIAQSRQDAEI
ncbi:hypothetical protein GQ55_9G405200 [Panicum hallii var. hallii]|uniref:YqgF/RNase H-like domain-containing protein n=1 Tax=Panicum hallii var. hallii TaxID=1504633 RepID=A0A2T7CA22_9POAL|nr:hypothetical protein GQ55_9G405200 [Panicum hallii var. hallii]